MKMRTINAYQHRNSYDFCWGVEGEPAIVTPVACDNTMCGCDRAHVGMTSGKASTMVMVRDVPLGFDELAAACVDHLTGSGFYDDRKVAAQDAADIVGAAVDVAARFPVGTVLRPFYDRGTDEWHHIEATG